MWALYLFGPLLEQLYGHIEYLAIYLLCAARSVLTILVAPDQAAVGASGAIFGLLGLAFAVSRRRHLALPRQTRAVLGQIGSLLVINLAFTFFVPGISITGHLGGRPWACSSAGSAALAGLYPGRPMAGRQRSGDQEHVDVPARRDLPRGGRPPRGRHQVVMSGTLA